MHELQGKGGLWPFGILVLDLYMGLIWAAGPDHVWISYLHRDEYKKKLVVVVVTSRRADSHWQSCSYATIRRHVFSVTARPTTISTIIIIIIIYYRTKRSHNDWTVISCRLDYCNSLLYGISDELLRRLQYVKYAAARLVTVTRRHEHITPVLRQLHWLPLRQRIRFKLAEFVIQSLAGLAPQCRTLPTTAV